MEREVALSQNSGQKEGESLTDTAGGKLTLKVLDEMGSRPKHPAWSSMQKTL